MKKELLVSLDEIQFLELTCPNEKCGARITFDLSSAREIPEQCKFCNDDWGGTHHVMKQPGPFLSFQRFRDFLLEKRFRPVFRIAESGAEETESR